MQLDSINDDRLINKKHLKNVGPIRHCEPPEEAGSWNSM